MHYAFISQGTVKPVLSGQSKEDQKCVFKTNNRLMQAKVLQNAPMEHSAVLLTCIKLPHGSKTFVLSIFSGCFRQVLLYLSIYCILMSILKLLCTFPVIIQEAPAAVGMAYFQIYFSHIFLSFSSIL